MGVFGHRVVLGVVSYDSQNNSAATCGLSCGADGHGHGCSASVCAGSRGPCVPGGVTCRLMQLSTHQFPSRVRQSAFRGTTCRFWHNDLKAVCRRRRFSSANAAFDTTFRKLRALSGVSRADMPLLTLHSAFRVPKASFPAANTLPLTQRSVFCVPKATSSA